MAKRSAPAPFLTKTFQLVDDRSTDDVVSWNDSGTAFVVWKMAEFAKDMLPNYFKHSNFSSFVRQLNTYGFRKIVPDKWEFANDNFKRGQEELLLQIRRRKAVTAIPSQSPVPMAGKSDAAGGSSSPSNSGEDLGSTSSLSPGNNAKSVADENAKLKRDNELLSSELAEMKKKCGDLVVFLSQYVKAGPDQIDRIMRQGRCGSIVDGFDGDASDECYEDDGDENMGGKGTGTGTGTGTGDGLKLFGVWVKEGKRKRRRKEMKAVDYEAPIPWPWMKKISASAGGEPSKIDFIFGSWLHCELPSGALNIMSLSVYLAPSTDAPNFVMEVIQSSPTSLVLILDLPPRKDLVLHSDYLQSFYEDPQLDRLRQLLEQIPEVQPYCSPSLFLRSVVSPTAMLMRAATEAGRVERMEEIVEDHVSPVAKQVLAFWLDQCAFGEREVGENERADLAKRDLVIRKKYIEIDMATNLPRLFGQEVADRVLGVIQEVFRA